jgi:arylsulfatase A-like enzyme
MTEKKTGRQWLKTGLGLIALAGLLWAGKSAWDRFGPSDPRPDVYIFLIDALRADHLGCYGYGRGTSPNIDAFAGKAALFEEANTAWTETHPSVTTIFTGLFPAAHGTMHSEDQIDKSLLLLPEVFKKAGYRTCSIVTNPHVAKYYGFDRGVDDFRYELKQNVNWVNGQAEEYLAARNPRQRVFMYLHTLEPHAPYQPRPATRRKFDRGFQGKCDGSDESLLAVGNPNPKLERKDWEHLIDLYDGEIYDADAGFADFLKLLKKYNRLDNALIILVADHGESFGEQDTRGHGLTLGRQEMRVPLILHFPQGKYAGKRITPPVSLIDIFPTLLAVSRAKPKLSYVLPGVDLKAIAEGSQSRPRPIYGEILKPIGDKEIHLGAIIDETGCKRVIDLSSPPYDIATRKSLGMWQLTVDPKEQKDLSRQDPARAAELAKRYAEWRLAQSRWLGRAPQTKSSGKEMPADIRRGLKSLGYLK